MTAASLTQSPEWLELQKHYEAMKGQTLAELVNSDEQRLENCKINIGPFSMNYALDFVNAETVGLLAKLAKARDLDGWRTRMRQGDKINNTENRAALHVALRQLGGTLPAIDEVEIGPLIKATRSKVSNFVNAVRSHKFLGATGKPIRNIVNIGIGGSDLGPRMAVEALPTFVKDMRAYFVANADGITMLQLSERLDPAETLFVIVSKTFTTQETLLNARTAKAWVSGHVGKQAVARHFVGVSSNTAAVEAFGIAPEQTFPMWDWVGGRFSLWSAVGITLELCIGSRAYEKLLGGAAAMDTHFFEAPFEKNMPVMLAMLGIWSRNFLGCTGHAVLPYSERLRELPRYLQQLEMESNGKSVGRDGAPVATATAPLLFGESGTVGQHSFYQWLHQGGDKVSADFIAATKDDLGRSEYHRTLLTNMAAQATALAFGQPAKTVPQDAYAGGRPSTLIMLEKIEPHNLGMLLALYEHKIFVQSVIWGINPFDQPGVELGKRMAKALADGTAPEGDGGAFAAKLYASLSA